MSQIARTVVLTGVHKGKTITLRGQYPFVDGELTLTGSEEDVNCEVRNLERNFCAYLKGDPRIDEVVTIRPSLGGERVNPADPNSPLTGDAGKKENDDGKRDLSTGGTDANGQGSVQGDGQPNGGGTDALSANNGGGAEAGSTGQAGGLSEGNGQPTGVTGGAGTLDLGSTTDLARIPDGPGKNMPDDKLKRAIAQLDAATDDHWTAEGKPSLAAVSKFYGSTAVKRADVDAVAPGYRRGGTL